MGIPPNDGVLEVGNLRTGKQPMFFSFIEVLTRLASMQIIFKIVKSRQYPFLWSTNPLLLHEGADAGEEKCCGCG